VYEQGGGNGYKYDAFVYDKKGITPTVFFSYNDKFYVGLGYQSTRHGWRNEPFVSQHGFYGRYSITQNAVSFGYYGIMNHLIGKWDLYLNADYDAIRWTNYFGIGNETVELPKDNMDYYRVRTREMFAGIGLNRRLGTTSNLRLTPFFQATKVINDEGRFLSETASILTLERSASSSSKWDTYTGVALNYTFADLDDAVVPRKGIAFSTGTAYTRSLQSERSINTYSGSLSFYIPISKQLGLAVRNAGATLTGEPKFYQLNSIGGSLNLRGYRRDRFRGRTAFYNSNELQWLFDFKSKVFNGKVGPVAFYDIGRVWQPDEQSSTWHSGYGAGILLAPFNRFSATVSYGISKENKVFHIKLSRNL
jgi:outer membrane protein assembly factor BamA